MTIAPELLRRIVEGALLAAGQPLTEDRLLSLIEEGERPEKADLQAVLQEIADSCAERGFELRQVASGWRFQVPEDLAPWVNRLWEEKAQKYSRATLETLAIIAYRQPITRGDIEEIRGVAVSSHIVKTLSERGWIKVVGQRDVPGKPSLYATTKEFLDYFNLRTLDDLPTLAEIRDIESLNQALDLGQLAEGAAAPDDGETAADSVEESVEENTEEGTEEIEAESAEDRAEVDGSARDEDGDTEDQLLEPELTDREPEDEPESAVDADSEPGAESDSLPYAGEDSDTESDEWDAEEVAAATGESPEDEFEHAAPVVEAGDDALEQSSVEEDLPVADEADAEVEEASAEDDEAPEDPEEATGNDSAEPGIFSALPASSLFGDAPVVDGTDSREPESATDDESAAEDASETKQTETLT